MNIQEAIAKNSKPELAEVECSMVYQVWEDGEVTLQKCGSLLGLRHLHMIKMGDPSRAVDADLFPHYTENANGKYGFIYTDNEGADEVRQLILAGKETKE